jgi:secreted PhoX family phosphatase
MKNKTPQPDFQAVLNARVSRRSLLKTMGKTSAGVAMTGVAPSLLAAMPAGQWARPFTEVPHGLDENLTLPEGYQYQVVSRWGDPLFADAPAFDPLQQTGENQAKQFGFNNDYVGFVPLKSDKTRSSHGLMVVNHEYTKAKLMHSGVREDRRLNKDLTEVDLNAHGLSVMEVRYEGGRWQRVLASEYTRRITPHTPMRFTGPAAGHKRMHSLSGPDGYETLGTYGNCAGGITPWGTVLSAEENIDGYFAGDIANLPEAENYQRFGFSGKSKKSWSKHHERWDLDKHAAEGLHVGWIVEIDPLDPNSTPVKHTALGRLKHEACTLHLCDDKRLVAYMGDDEEFEYVYRFVSEGRYCDRDTMDAKKHNSQLLSEGVLSVARFEDDGRLVWMPLVYGSGPINEKNGFHSQADVCLDTRKAADLLGATPMDRPEDIEVNPHNGHVYIMLTKGPNRDASQVDAVNPRANNSGGHILELRCEDHTADTVRWEMFLLAGNHRRDASGKPSASWLAAPDNCTFDRLGNLWVSSDGAEKFGVADGLWLIPTEGSERAKPTRFLRAPIGAEVCGPCFTADNRTLFCAIQHPGNDGSFDRPDTRWPDFVDELPARPSLIAIQRSDGQAIV